MNKFLRVSIVAALLAGLASCATDGMNEAMGIGAISSSKSTFDGATIVEMTPAFLADGTKTLGSNKAVMLGGRWSSAAPDLAALILSYDGLGRSAAFTNIGGLDVNIGGKITSYKTTSLTSHKIGAPVMGNVPTESRNAVIVPLPLLRQMVSAPDVRLRVHTGDGYEDSVFSEAQGVGGGSTAIVPMRKFIAHVDATARPTK